MAIILKRYQIYVVDVDGSTVIDDLGYAILTIGEYNGSISLTRQTDLNALRSYIPDCDDWRPIWLQFENSPNLNYLNAMLGYFPNTQVIQIRNSHNGKKLKYVSDSGYYAVTETNISISGSVSSNGRMSLYDNNGTLLASNVVGLIDGIFPNDTGTVKVAESIVNNDISGYLRTGDLTIRITSSSQYALYVDVANGTNNSAVLQWYNGCPDYDPHADPYLPGGESDTGGGEGSFDDTSIAITIPSLPTLSAVDSGFITLYNPSINQLKTLASYMWTGGFDINTFRKIFADPMDCILGLSIVPVAIPDGGIVPVTVGNNATGVNMTRAGSQYVSVDCGSLTINEFWGAYLDYSPYTKVDIYLPFIGIHQLNTDDVMNKTLHVVYHVDILSGACTAYIECDGTVLYQFIGQCSSSIPITGKDWTNVINGVLGVAGAIGSMVATGGASAPMVAPVLASSAVNALKPNVEKSGSMSGTGGMMAIQTPYIIVTRPKQALPSGQNAMEGYPSYVTRQLGNLSGYTEVAEIHLTGIPCTQQELDEIDRLLGEGVYL